MVRAGDGFNVTFRAIGRHDCAGEVESGRESVYLQVTGPSWRFREEAAAVMAPYPQAASWLVVRRP